MPNSFSFFFGATVIACLPLLVSAQDQQESHKELVNPPSLPDSTQFGYSQATIAPAGTRLVHVAGQVGFIETEADNGFERQAARAFNNLEIALREAGSNPASVVQITLLIVDHDAKKLALMGQMRKSMFGENLPASILIPVPKLYTPGVLFEIGAVAIIDPNDARGAE